ncbi:uncharacterized protein SETTUDRAFT_166566 [Exserohilum turcica Et28A]|uniref:Uncharacterized protein n=1 Tax=Exserohilum turcicum (strain 28A) TaxID=671987 RepID=R0J1E6_EXST2|nr:uncharacterized protein SETTUDRAFT_166566 [Exserohilum turcica Et28A]EOA90591.1 hypothetical protein SETTUDRAFT_166566 [Exserohilum turcica Et28A]
MVWQMSPLLWGLKKELRACKHRFSPASLRHPRPGILLAITDIYWYAKSGMST